MSENYFLLNLDDPAVPGYCSFSKTYLGTQEDLTIVANRLEKEKLYPETVRAIRRYFNGNTASEHNIAYKKQKVLIPTTPISEYKSQVKNRKWTHYNVWGFPYEMKLDSAIISQIIITNNSYHYRYIKAWMRNLCYKSYGGEWTPLKDGFWGNSSILDVTAVPGTTDFILHNLLYVEEERYEAELKHAINDITDEEKIEFQKICDEIFADG